MSTSRLFPANLACAVAMAMWAIGFPASEVLLDSWGAVSLLVVRMSAGVLLLLVAWLWIDGRSVVAAAPWMRGILIGAAGFGVGTVMLLVGQKMSDAVTPAIAAAMMPLAGVSLEVVLDGRRLRWTVVAGVLFAIAGGIVAAGVRLADARFGIGALLCLGAIFLFAWGTRATTRNLPELTSTGQSALTLTGAYVFVVVMYVGLLGASQWETAIGRTDITAVALILLYSVVSLAVAQVLWIWGSAHIGIMMASLHMNAVPFYVMVVVVIALEGVWSWTQAAGALLVGIGVLLAQSRARSAVEHRAESGTPG